jgi:hypothetical protein
MKLHEIASARISLQAALKKLAEPCGTFEDIFGEDAVLVADAVHDKATSKVFCLNDSTGLGKATARSVMNSPAIEEVGRTKIVRLNGMNRAIVKGGKVYVGEYYHGRLIEETE